MAVTLSPKRSGRKISGHGCFAISSFLERPSLLLRIVVLLIVVVLMFQMKLLNKVNEITSNITNLSDKNAAHSLLPPIEIRNSTRREKSSGRKEAINKAVEADYDTSAASSGATQNQIRHDDNNDEVNYDKYPNCPFRGSSLVESIYVYPVPASPDFQGDILSPHAQSYPIDEYPWVAVDAKAKADGSGPYDTTSQLVQYNTELMVRDVITHPDSCLRTNDPDRATLFYVPYLPSAEFHQGSLHLGDYSTTKYGQAIMDIVIDNKYDGWEKHFGLTSKYWKQRGGSDHILVFSEPMHGTWHPREFWVVASCFFHCEHDELVLTLSLLFFHTYRQQARQLSFHQQSIST